MFNNYVLFKIRLKKKVILLTSSQLPTITTTQSPAGKLQIQSSPFSLPEDPLLPDAQESTRIPTNFDKKMLAGKRSVLMLLCTMHSAAIVLIFGRSLSYHFCFILQKK